MGCTASQEEFQGVQPLLDSTAEFSICLSLLRVKKPKQVIPQRTGKVLSCFRSIHSHYLMDNMGSLLLSEDINKS